MDYLSFWSMKNARMEICDHSCSTYSWILLLYWSRCYTLLSENECGHPQVGRLSWYANLLFLIISGFCLVLMILLLLLISSVPLLQQSEQYFLQQTPFAPCRYLRPCALRLLNGFKNRDLFPAYWLQVLNQDETPLLYSLVFGEGVVNDATSVVLFNAIQNFDLSHINSGVALELIGNFLYLFVASTLLGVVVRLLLSLFFFVHVCIPTTPVWELLLDLKEKIWPFWFLQAGLLSAYIIKKLYFGRFVN